MYQTQHTLTKIDWHISSVVGAVPLRSLVVVSLIWTELVINGDPLNADDVAQEGHLHLMKLTFLSLHSTDGLLDFAELL